MPPEMLPGQGQPPAAQGQSPPGSSPATTSVPNRGQEAQALAGLSVLVDGLLKLAPLFGAGSDVGQAVLKAATMLSKHVPPGSTSPGVKNTAMTQMQREHQQNQPIAAMMAAQQKPAAPPPAAAA